MRKRLRRRGFTIVELVIVIGVIGILAAILIPTFINLTNRAKGAEQKSFLKNVNTQLAVREADPQYGPNKTMYDAIVASQDFGFDVEKITPIDGDDIIWDSVANRFAMVTSDFDANNPNADTAKIVYSDGQFKGKGAQLWRIYDSMPSTQTYSIYARKGWSQTTISNLTVGFDVGVNTNIGSLTFTEPTKADTYVFRTSTGTFNVNAPNATIKHYGESLLTNIEAVADASFHEYGGAKDVVVKKGRYHVNGTSIVSNIFATAESGAATVDVESGAIIGSIIVSGNQSNQINVTTKAGLQNFTNLKVLDSGSMSNLNINVQSAPSHANIADQTSTGVSIKGVGADPEPIAPDCGGTHGHDFVTLEEYSIRVCTICGAVEYISVVPNGESGEVIEEVKIQPTADTQAEGEAAAATVVLNQEYGFHDSYKMGSGAQEHWVHEIDSVEEFLNLKAHLDPIDAIAKKTSRTEQEEQDLAEAVKSEYVLLRDIDMSGNNDSVLADATFFGTLNGNKHAIKNYTQNDLSKDGGGIICRYYSDTIVKDLTLDKIKISAMESSGILFGKSWRHANNFQAPVGKLTVSGLTINENCLLTGVKGLGGIAGSTRALAEVSATGCVNKAEIVATSYNTGGFFGTMSWVPTISLVECENHGKIRATANVGGLLGQSPDVTTLTIQDCKNYGRVTTFGKANPNNKARAGWFAAMLETVTSCNYSGNYNEGKIAYVSSNESVLTVLESDLVGDGIALKDDQTVDKFLERDDTAALSVTKGANNNMIVGAITGAAYYTVTMQIYARDVVLSGNTVTVIKEHSLPYMKRFNTVEEIASGFGYITRAGYVLNSVYTQYDYNTETTSYTSTIDGVANYFRLPYASRGNYNLGEVSFDTSLNEWVFVFDGQAGYPEGTGQILSPKNTYVMYLVAAYDSNDHIMASSFQSFDTGNKGGSYVTNMNGDVCDDWSNHGTWPAVA